MYLNKVLYECILLNSSAYIDQTLQFLNKSKIKHKFFK